MQAFSVGRGNAGNVTVNAGGHVFLEDRSAIFSAVTQTEQFRGEGEGGDINIRARSLSLSSGSQIAASTEGRGNAGNIRIDAADSVDGRDGSVVQAVSLGEGNAGIITITAGDRVAFDGVGANGFSSGAFSSVEGDAFRGDRRAGDVNIEARSLSLSNGAILETSTRNSGNAGNIQLNINDSVSISGGAILRAVSTSQGNSGNVTINAGGLIFIDGRGSTGVSSGIINSLGVVPQFGGNRRGGDIRISGRSLSVTNGAQVGAITVGQGNVGNIQVDVTDDVLIGGGSVLQTILGARGNAGNITINAGNRISLDGESGVFSAVVQTEQFRGEGEGGDINIRARSLSLTNGAQLNASNIAQGGAGSIDVGVRSLDLDQGNIFAITNSGDGGNIQLRTSKSLRLRNSSQIATSAGLAQLAGDGGNITIVTPLLVANFDGNNDIVGNAFGSRGGRVEINTQSAIGLTPRSIPELRALLGTDDPTLLDPSRLPSNDVASLSSFSLNFDSGEVFSASDLVELPTTPVDASALVATGCPSGVENRFVVTGGGGLPPAPGDKLSADALLTDWATLTAPETQNRATVETTTPEVADTAIAPLVEATTWQFGSKGEIVLTNADPATPNQFEATPSNCPSS
ncbi:hypothetical protein DSM107010_34640 [Chroococcidiopsis cubana SAG 39.79]|uniref:Filamentous haemagglutinin FhaB/tRNA nuclease CdiA-like TPS domain-containing protein n=1 Tax=Chroococcidiopsis cubana SAG 39.79 TaxID=388085 RepID=A0AB37UIJ2_9CYAN|nr:S-layer family protein [Chroococcidiopsis cubana]RUT11195.1 hypothetical protein DSM107010_34640 [Chroococcidiopsis cubana SAG 39.79]